MSEVAEGDPGKVLQCVDVRSGGTFRFQAQRLFVTGLVDTTWRPDSTQVCVGSAQGYGQRAIPDGTGGAFIVWVDPRDGFPDVRLGRVDGGGAVRPGWSDEGLSLSPYTASRDHVAGCADGAGGAYVAWTEFRGAATSTIRLVRVAEGGAPTSGWPAGGALAGSGGHEQSHPAVMPVAGGAVVTWLERRDGRLGVRMQRFTAEGTRAAGWSEEGAEVVEPAPGGHISHQQALVCPNGDLVLVWREEHPSGGTTIRAAALRAGSPPTVQTTEVRVLSSEATLQSEPTVVVSGAHVFVAWTERTAGSEGVRLQRLTAAGGPDPAWPAAGVLVAESSIGFDPPAVLPEAGGGAVLAWTDRREIASGDIYAGRVLAEGTIDPNWPASGRPVCTALGDQFRPALAPDGTGGAIVSWIDAGTQTVAGFLSLRAYAVGQIELIETILDPGRVRLAWRAPTGGDVTYRVYRRLSGAAWAHVSDLVEAASGRLELDDRSAPEGQRADYALSIERGGVERFLAPIAVDVPVTPDRLTLRTVQLSSSGQAIRVEFALPRGPVARLELIDVTGRRIGERHLTGFEPGVRVAEVHGRGRIRAGVYFVRLHQGPVVLTHKFVAVQ